MDNASAGLGKRQGLGSKGKHLDLLELPENQAELRRETEKMKGDRENDATTRGETV